MIFVCECVFENCRIIYDFINVASCTFAELSNGFQYTAMALWDISSISPTSPTEFFVSASKRKEKW